MEILLCCFCNNIIDSDVVNPCDISILTNWDKPKNKQHNQTFWCHINCFRKALHSEVRDNLVVDLLTDKDENC